MLRDCFKQVPELYCPEETHFFRWACPFRGNEFVSIYNTNKTLLKHRSMDGVSSEEFRKIVSSSKSKRDLTDLYCAAVADRRGKTAWFEKTPQNVYGLPLIAEQYPEAKVIHIVRHPYRVVKSLLVGKVIKVDDIVGAANYWMESVAIVNVTSRFLGDRLMEVRYEDFTESPGEIFREMCLELDIGSPTVDFSKIKKSTSQDAELLSESDKAIVHDICGKYMERYGYA